MVRIDEARLRFGARVDTLIPLFHEADPLADEAVLAARADGPRAVDRALEGRSGSDALSALADAHGSLPAGFAPERARRGGRLFFRTGLLGGMALGARSLVAGYCSPAGNKPLARTGGLERDGARRLAETGRFVTEVHREGGMVPGAPGWKTTLRVRLMHAQVRRLLWEAGDWRSEAWGEPLNQHDLLATALLFTVVWVDGLRTLGVRVGRDEVDDHLHLWRWVGEVMGIRPSLLPRTEPEGVTLAQVIDATQEPPDDDARALVRALLHPRDGQAPPQMGEGLCRALMGDAMADALGLARTPWQHLPRLTRAASLPVELARRVHPGVEDRLVASGLRYWEGAIAQGLGGGAARFALPRALRPRAASENPVRAVPHDTAAAP